MSEETLFTAVRRIIRFIRVDDERHGGLLSQETIQAAEILAREVDKTEKQMKQGAENERTETEKDISC